MNGLGNKNTLSCVAMVMTGLNIKVRGTERIVDWDLTI